MKTVGQKLGRRRAAPFFARVAKGKADGGTVYDGTPKRQFADDVEVVRINAESGVELMRSWERRENGIDLAKGCSRYGGVTVYVMDGGKWVGK